VNRTPSKHFRHQITVLNRDLPTITAFNLAHSFLVRITDRDERGHVVGMVEYDHILMRPSYSIP
jgi:hypothetical protein